MIGDCRACRFMQALFLLYEKKTNHIRGGGNAVTWSDIQRIHFSNALDFEVYLMAVGYSANNFIEELAFGNNYAGIMLNLVYGNNEVINKQTAWYEMVDSTGTITLNPDDEYHLYAIGDTSEMNRSGMKVTDMPYSFPNYEFKHEFTSICKLLDFKYNQESGLLESTANHFIPRSQNSNELKMDIYNNTLLVLSAGSYQFRGTQCNHTGNYDQHAILITPIDSNEK